MADALTLENMSPELLEVVERAQREPEGRFHSLAHLLDVPALERAFHRLRKDAAVGVDGVTKEEYAKETGEAVHRRVVSTQSAPAGKGAARSAHETSCWTLQLLWGERQLPQLGLSSPRDAPGLVQVAAPSQPA